MWSLNIWHYCFSFSSVGFTIKFLLLNLPHSYSHFLKTGQAAHFITQLGWRRLHSDSLRNGRFGVRNPLEAKFSLRVHTTHLVQWLPGFFTGDKAAEVWHWWPTLSSNEVKERVELYIPLPPTGHSRPVAGRTSSVLLTYEMLQIAVTFYVLRRPCSKFCVSKYPKKNRQILIQLSFFLKCVKCLGTGLNCVYYLYFSSTGKTNKRMRKWMWNCTRRWNEITLTFIVRFTLFGFARRRNMTVMRDLGFGPLRSIKTLTLSDFATVKKH
jgi:hypothetical protein